MKKRILIIGAGVGGLSAGIYGQMQGFETQIFEMHNKPGGQCTSWKRKGYVFDGCLHHFGGFDQTSMMYDFWKEVGAIPCDTVDVQECVSVLDSDGTFFHDYYDLDRLERHMKALAPTDAGVIDEYLACIRCFQKGDPFGAVLCGSVSDKLRYGPYFLKRMKYMRQTLDSFAEKFSHPLLRKAFPLLNYSQHGIPLFFYCSKHVAGSRGGMVWPKGGSITLTQNMARNYESLGGALHLGKKVVRIVTKNDEACGIELADGSIVDGDIVISNADGRKTIMELLEGRYTNEKIEGYCHPRTDSAIPFAVQVFLGVRRDFSALPSSLVLFLREPVTIAGEKCEHLDLQIYGFDDSMAPEGKGVIKVELFSKYSYFAQLKDDHRAYKAEKEKVAEQVIAALEEQFLGLGADVEETDVVTLHTWERYMGGTHGFDNAPNKGFSFLGAMMGLGEMDRLPGLENFYFVGQWVTSAGALVLNALAGKKAIVRASGQMGV